MVLGIPNVLEVFQRTWEQAFAPDGGSADVIVRAKVDGQGVHISRCGFEGTEELSTDSPPLAVVLDHDGVDLEGVAIGLKASNSSSGVSISYNLVGFSRRFPAPG
jgi:hypothetical protein